MSVLLTGSGGLFTRLGHLQGSVLDILAYSGGALTPPDTTPSMKTRANTVAADFANGTARRDIVDGLYTQLTSLQSAQTGFLSYLQQIAQTTVVQMVNDDVKQPDTSLKTAMTTLIAQMVSAGDYVGGSTVAAGSQTAVGSPTGTPIVVASVKDGKGKTLEYAFPDVMTFRCTGDAQAGSITAKQEPFTVTGQAAVASTLSYLWPGGSGATSSLTCVDAGQNNSAGNVLQNSDFETFTTANVPDNWTIDVGAAGTTVFNGGSGNAYTGSGSLQFTGDVGGTLMAVTQKFNTTPSTAAGSGGTSAVLTPETPYAFNCWVKCDSTPAAGVLRFRLVDGSGTVIADSAGTDNSFTKSLTAVSTSWVNVNGVFRLPAVRASTVKLQIALSTAIDSTVSVFIDRVGLSQMTQFYAGGPFISIFSGATNVITGDSWTVAITNTYGVWCRAFEMLFSMRSLGLVLPVSGGGSQINDNLVA